MILSPLEKACTSLGVALSRSKAAPKDLELRDACIQRFEYTYELCVKSIKRYLEEETVFTSEIDRWNYRDLMRVAHESGLIQNVELWFEYREARNQTSHAYDENKAKAVYKVLPEFLVQAESLIANLKIRLDR